jgi:glycosyltransferase involved in cell wall biosynthesis
MRCARYIRDNDIQIIQTHDFYTNVIGMSAGFLARVPARIAAKRETGLRTAGQSFVERRAFRMADRIVVNAEAVKNYLIGLGVPLTKITTIYNGLDLGRVDSIEVDRRAILEKFGLPSAPTMQFVTILANLRSPVKNHRMFLRAAQLVKEKVANVNFIVAGEGELVPETKAYAASLGLENDTFFTGLCTNVAELLSISNVGVLSSRSEGFSNSILEYMAAAKPVVATAVGGASEAIIDGETGYLVESDDHETLSERLTELLTNVSKAVEFGRRGRERVSQYFSLENQLHGTLELYDQLCTSRPRK